MFSLDGILNCTVYTSYINKRETGLNMIKKLLNYTLQDLNLKAVTRSCSSLYCEFWDICKNCLNIYAL